MADTDLTRPIIGIENRTAQEVFDIMCDRFRRAQSPSPAPGVEALKEAAVRFEEIRLVLVHHLHEPERSAFWKAVDGRKRCQAVLASLAQGGDATPANPAQVTDATEDRRQFKNFHRLLCERFGYTHDEKDWFRDQVSLIEHIAAIGAGGQAVARACAICGGPHDNDLLSDICQDCESSAPWCEDTHPVPSGQAVAVKALDLSNLLKHAFSAGYVSAAGDDGWIDYDPTKCAAYSRILSAIAHPVQPGWRDMESVPKDGTWVIAYRPNKSGGYLDRVVIVRWDDEVSAWVWPDQPFDVYEDDFAERLAAHGLGDHIDTFEDNAFTHWMPLPAAPKPKGE